MGAMSKASKGGALYAAKPYVDIGLLSQLALQFSSGVLIFTLLGVMVPGARRFSPWSKGFLNRPKACLRVLWVKHKDMLLDLAGYEILSRNQVPDVLSFMKLEPLIKGLLEVAPSAEIHPKSLSMSLLRALSGDPAMNSTAFRGDVWAGLKAERITTLLNHTRRLAREKHNPCWVAKLSGKAYQQFVDLLDMVDLKEQQPLHKEDQGTVAGHYASTVAYDVSDPGSPVDKKVSPKRGLKREVSAASMDSDGFPSMLRSPKMDKGPCKKGSSSDPPASPGSPAQVGVSPVPRRLGRKSPPPAAAAAAPGSPAVRRRIGQKSPPPAAGNADDQYLQLLMGYKKTIAKGKGTKQQGRGTPPKSPSPGKQPKTSPCQKGLSAVCASRGSS